MRAVSLLFTLLTLVATTPSRAETEVKVGWCARTMSAAAAPYAVAQKLGWFAERGLKVTVVPLPGSTACVKTVATGDLPYSVPSIEPLLIIHPQGVKARIFYTAYQSFGYGLAVPADSPITSVAGLKGKTVGVTSMDSAGVIVARAQAALAGLNPQTDIRIVVAGEGAQTAALLRGKQIEALSQFDTQYAMVENAGQALRYFDNGPMTPFPGNGFLALESRLASHRAEAAAIARGFAMGEVFTIANPEAAIRILYDVYPATKPTGKDEATAIRDDVHVLRARMAHWSLESGGVTRWGESNIANFDAYIDFLVKWQIVPQKVPARDLVTNDLLDEINTFDAAKIRAQALAWKP